MFVFLAQPRHLIYYALLAVPLILLTFWITRRLALRKMRRAVMKAEHNYQQQIASSHQRLFFTSLGMYSCFTK